MSQLRFIESALSIEFDNVKWQPFLSHFQSVHSYSIFAVSWRFFASVKNQRINISICAKCCLRHNKSIIKVQLPSLNPYITFTFVFSLFHLHKVFLSQASLLRTKKNYFFLLKNDRIKCDVRMRETLTRETIWWWMDGMRKKLPAKTLHWLNGVFYMLSEK